MASTHWVPFSKTSKKSGEPKKTDLSPICDEEAISGFDLLFVHGSEITVFDIID